MPTNTYLALTIGPIYKTMQQSRKTRELWCVSFTFSRLMKHLIDSLSAYGELLSPNGKAKQRLHGAGVYPDRCYLKLINPLEPQQISELKNEALKAFSHETGIDTGLDYYQIYAVQCELSKNPIGKLNVILDTIELQQKYHQKKTLDFDKVYWNNADKSKSKIFFQKLYKVGYETNDILPILLINNIEKVPRFPSIPEISTNELAKKDQKKYWGKIGYQGIETSTGILSWPQLRTDILDDDDDIIRAIKEAFPEDFKFQHKYFSIVHADGDNVGKLIGKIEEKNEDIGEFSSALNSFAELAADLLVSYGAFPVYIGGDDLLFFAPIANNSLNDRLGYPSTDPSHGNIFGNSLFFLLSKLNETFKEALSSITSQYSDLLPVSLSFGIMVGYYKHPMSEIQKESYNLLLHTAKKQPGKNYIAMKVQKHSGQTFEFGFMQQGPLYECFLKLTTTAQDKKENFLNSVMYKLDDQKMVIERINHHKERLGYFFSENFNEAKHKDYDEFFEQVQVLILETFKAFPGDNLDEKMERIYSALRFVQFLIAKDDD